MLEKITKLFEKLSREELLQLKEALEQIIKNKFKDDLGRRVSKRAKVKIPASCIIEREKEFFVKEHKIIILEMSVNGMVFRTDAVIYKNDLLGISFRSPSTAEKKYIDCQALRIKELKNKTGFEVEVAVKAVDKKIVKAYQDMLSKRAGINAIS